MVIEKGPKNGNCELGSNCDLASDDSSELSMGLTCTSIDFWSR